jgi:hypothetical protein
MKATGIQAACEKSFDKAGSRPATPNEDVGNRSWQVPQARLVWVVLIEERITRHEDFAPN